MASALVRELLWRHWLGDPLRASLQLAAAQADPDAAGGQAADRPDAAEASEDAKASAPAPPLLRPVYHVGLVFALGIEAGALVDRLSGVVKIKGAGFVAREGGLAGKRLLVLESGVGRDAAARGTRALLAGHRPRWVISAGFAGGLDPKLAKGDILMADRLTDEQGRQLEVDFKVDPATLADNPRLHVGPLVTVDRIVHDPAAKLALGQHEGALAFDMESLAVAEVCRAERARFLAIRVISDAVDQELPRDVEHLVRQKSLAGRLGAAGGAIFRRPSSIKDIWRLKEDALLASERLASFLTGIIPQLP